ncbi:MAG TPA: hypothetical protein DER58_02620 [Firmicutes bacterium]|jgi:hypothetical protein|nr:hypothetical protein [Bacillota bacterium]
MGPASGFAGTAFAITTLRASNVDCAPDAALLEQYVADDVYTAALQLIGCPKPEIARRRSHENYGTTRETLLTLGVEAKIPDTSLLL